MLLLVGLGNPGRDAEDNRHNIGFMAVDAVIARFGLGAPRARRQPAGLFSDGVIDGNKVMVLKPRTYMNDSGRAVGAAVRYWKLAPEDVIVFHDELDLAPGKVRVKQGGGHGGHNGLRSIDSHIGKDYRRVRLGIGHPSDRSSAAVSSRPPRRSTPACAAPSNALESGQADDSARPYDTPGSGHNTGNAAEKPCTLRVGHSRGCCYSNPQRLRLRVQSGCTDDPASRSAVTRIADTIH